MAEYVAKHRAFVRLSLPHQEPIAGELALNPNSALRDGPQTLLELLNSPHRTLPFERADGQVLLVTRLQIHYIAPGPDVPAEYVSPPSFVVSREEQVSLTFADGHNVTGRIQIELPDHLNRTSDFLNAADDFFALRTAGGVMLVNKACMRDMRVTQPSPRPVGANNYFHPAPIDRVCRDARAARCRACRCTLSYLRAGRLRDSPYVIIGVVGLHSHLIPIRLGPDVNVHAPNGARASTKQHQEPSCDSGSNSGRVLELQPDGSRSSRSSAPSLHSSRRRRSPPRHRAPRSRRRHPRRPGPAASSAPARVKAAASTA